MVHELAKLLEPWKNAFGDSALIAGTVTGVHILALLFGGGLAIAADRTTLRSMRRDPAARLEQLRELHAVHRPVLIALTLLFVSGIALAAADVKTFLESPIFWVKLALVTLLLANGAVLTWIEGRLRSEATAVRTDRLWHLMRLASIASLVLWTSTAIAGTALANM